MTFSVNELDALFEEARQMLLPQRFRNWLAQERLPEIDDFFSDFILDQLTQVFHSMQTPISGVPEQSQSGRTLMVLNVP